jgi:RNA polymerase sigma-70 factor, ECF subfamily
MTRQNLSAEELFRDHYDFVSRFSLRVGVRSADVEDVAQEVFMLAHRKGGYIAGEASPRSWLARLVLGIASTRRRSTRRRAETAENEASAPVDPSTPEHHASQRERLDRVQRAVEALDEEHRAVFVLFELEGASSEEIGFALQIPTGTVHSRLHTARRKFMAAHERLLLAESRRLGTGVVHG